MALIDAQTRLGTAQALSASGATTDYLDTTKARNLGDGEALAMVFTVTTAIAGTTPTCSFAVQSDSSSGFGTAVTHVTASPAAAALVVGAQIVVVIPVAVAVGQFIRGLFTLGGTTPTISVTTDIVPLSMVKKTALYASGFAVQ